MSDLFHTLFTYFAVFPAVFAPLACFAEFNIRAQGAGAAVFAYVFAAICTVVSPVTALSDCSVTLAAVLTMITVIISTLSADTACFTKLFSCAKRTIITFGAVKLLVARYAVHAAGRAVVIFTLFIVIDNVDSAVLAHRVSVVLGVILDTLFTHQTI